MTRTVLLSTRSQREFSEIDRRTRERLRVELLSFAATGKGDVKKLRGVRGGIDLYRLRVGDWRVVFERNAREVRVTRIIHRSIGYEWL